MPTLISYLRRLFRRWSAVQYWVSPQAWTCTCTPNLAAWPWHEHREKCGECQAPRPNRGKFESKYDVWD